MLTGEYDVVILDVMMPAGHRRVERRLRVATPRAAGPVLFLTARAAAADRAKGLELGADELTAGLAL